MVSLSIAIIPVIPLFYPRGKTQVLKMVCPGPLSIKTLLSLNTQLFLTPTCYWHLFPVEAGFSLQLIYAVYFSVLQVIKLTNNLFAFTWNGQQYTCTVMPQGFTKSPYFSHILKADLDDMKFSTDFALLKYIDDLLLCSPPTSSQGDSIHLLKLWDIKSPKKNCTLLKLSFDI